jgi:hypothetical protein
MNWQTCRSRACCWPGFLKKRPTRRSCDRTAPSANGHHAPHPGLPLTTHAGQPPAPHCPRHRKATPTAVQAAHGRTEVPQPPPRPSHAFRSCERHGRHHPRLGTAAAVHDLQTHTRAAREASPADGTLLPTGQEPRSAPRRFTASEMAGPPGTAGPPPGVRQGQGGSRLRRFPGWRWPGACGRGRRIVMPAGSGAGSLSLIRTRAASRR